MTTCFVIQQFDSTYDQRFRDTFSLAIRKGGATPVRADEILGTAPIIEKIIERIEQSTIIFAEISENNPNVFLELGFALSMNKPCVLVCQREQRERLPFDVAHRPVILYSTRAQSDWETLGSEIEKNVKAALSEADHRRSVEAAKVSPGRSVDIDFIMEQCIIYLLQNDMRSKDGVSFYYIQRDLSGPTISQSMIALSLARLIEQGLAEKEEAFDPGPSETYFVFRLSEQGRAHVVREYSRLQESEIKKMAVEPRLMLQAADDLNDDVPF